VSADPASPGPPSAGRPTRVATILHGDADRAGPYVDAVLPADVVRLESDDDRSPWLDVAHLEAHADEIDVLHLHLGDPHVAAVAVQCWAETVRRLGLPLVVTVHRVPPPGRAPRNPAEAEYQAHLEAVLATAEVVLTLTPGAADEIAERFGRTAIVVAHPSTAVPDPALGAERGLVGLRLGAPQPGVPDAWALVRAVQSGAVSGGGRLRVLTDDERHVGRAVHELAERGDLELVVHTPAERVAQLQQLHVAVLPEPPGTHSQDLEVCRDVGTLVVAPTSGWSAEQWSEVVSYRTDASGWLDALSLTGAVAAALTRPMPRPADQGWRAEQRAAVQAVHAAVYRQVAADRALI
jgi:Glycosyltransferase Family 4